MRPDGSIQFPCAFGSLHRGAPEMSLREIYDSPEVRKIIRQSPQMWDFCKGCKIGCRNFVGAANLAAFAEVPHLRRLPDDLSHFRGIIDFAQTHLWRAAMKRAKRAGKLD